MIHFCRITGLLLCLVFGSQLLFLNLREREIRFEREEIQVSGVHTFARITRTQKLNKLSPLIKPRYYFSIQGKFNNDLFEKSERVTSAMYHLYSVGSNIEVTIVAKPESKVFFHIRKNQLPYGETPVVLFWIARSLSLAGLALILFGFIVGPLLGKIFPIPLLQNYQRPTLEQKIEN